MVNSPRYLKQFISVDGAYNLTFPQFAYEYEATQPVRSSSLIISGNDFALDLLQGRRAPLGVAREVARLAYLNDSLITLDADIDALKAALYYGNDGYIYTEGFDGSIRRARGRIVEMPPISFGEQPHAIPTALTFDRLSVWESNTQSDIVTVVTTNNQNFTINNAGNAYVTAMKIRIRANATSGFINPNIYNSTLGGTIAFISSRDSAGANDELMLDTSRPYIGYSTDDGANYANDIAQYVLPPLGARALGYWLKPGNNTIVANFGATPNCNIHFIYRSAWL